MEDVPLANDEARGTGWWILAAIAGVAFVALILAPGFLKARESSARNSCQGNMERIDSAVQQYMLELGIESRAMLVAMIGTEQKDWEKHLVGQKKIIRYSPKCPTGSEYVLNPSPDDPPVSCRFWLEHPRETRHLYVWPRTGS